MFQTTEKRESLIGKSGVYKITLIGTNRHYVGQARNIDKRMRGHINDARCHYAKKVRRTKLAYALEKYGVEAFSFEVLAVCSIGNLNKFEADFIAEFDCVKTGFNIREFETGDGYHPPTKEETREKLRIANTGKKRSPETLQRMRESALKKPPISEATRAKMVASQTGKTRSEEWKQKTRERMTGKKLPESWRAALQRGAMRRAKPVHQFDLDGNFIAEFSSVQEAARKAGKSQSNLTGALQGRLKTHNGYLWKYAPSQPN